MKFAAVDAASYNSLGELLTDACLTWKTKTALVEFNRKRENHRLTYQQVAKRANTIARRLQRQGVQAGDRVAIVLSNQSNWLISAMAIFQAGAVLVPLDHKLSGAEQLSLLLHCKPKLAITEWGLLKTWPERPCSVWVVEAPKSAELTEEELFETVPSDLPPLNSVSRDRQNLATIVYSSGTGGTPKGCMLSHGAYLSQLDGLLERFPMCPSDRYFSILPTNHAIDFMVGFVGPFCCGATVIHQRTLRPELIRWTMRTTSPTHMSVVPLILQAFADSINEKLDELSSLKRAALDVLVSVNRRLTERKPRHEISSRLLGPVHHAFGGELKLVVCGGAATSRALCDFFYDFGIPVVVGYGLTEACTAVSVNHIKPYRSDSVGDALKHVDLQIAEPNEQGVGEVLIGGPTLMMGYLNEPELTSKTLINGLLHTGDLGRIDASGHLHLVGRIKDVIVTAGGKNVYPQDIEFAFRDVPVEHLAVFAENTLFSGRSLHGEKLIIVVQPGSDAYIEAIRSANRRLPDYKRVSAVIEWPEAFPFTASMKLKRKQLAAAIATDEERVKLLPV